MRLVSDPQSYSFCIQVGDKVYWYHRNKLQELLVEASKILAYGKGIVLYQDKSSDIQAYSL